MNEVGIKIRNIMKVPLFQIVWVNQESQFSIKEEMDVVL